MISAKWLWRYRNPPFCPRSKRGEFQGVIVGMLGPVEYIGPRTPNSPRTGKRGYRDQHEEIKEGIQA